MIVYCNLDGICKSVAFSKKLLISKCECYFPRWLCRTIIQNDTRYPCTMWSIIMHWVPLPTKINYSRSTRHYFCHSSGWSCQRLHFSKTGTHFIKIFSWFHTWIICPNDQGLAPWKYSLDITYYACNDGLSRRLETHYSWFCRYGQCQCGQ